MAKNDKGLDKALNNAIEDILKDWRGSVVTAIDYAIGRAEDDWMNKAKSCLSEYYNNYKPEDYDRINILQYAFLPYKDVKYGKDKVVGSIGVQYDASVLEAHIGDPVTYQGKDGSAKIKHTGYYGSAKHQPVDAWWVIQNYLLGLHPDGGDDMMDFHIDNESPHSKMERYKKEYEKTFDQNILIGLLAQIAKKM